MLSDTFCRNSLGRRPRQCGFFSLLFGLGLPGACSGCFRPDPRSIHRRCFYLLLQRGAFGGSRGKFGGFPRLACGSFGSLLLGLDPHFGFGARLAFRKLTLPRLCRRALPGIDSCPQFKLGLLLFPCFRGGGVFQLGRDPRGFRLVGRLLGLKAGSGSESGILFCGGTPCLRLDRLFFRGEAGRTDAFRGGIPFGTAPRIGSGFLFRYDPGKGGNGSLFRSLLSDLLFGRLFGNERSCLHSISGKGNAFPRVRLCGGKVLRFDSRTQDFIRDKLGIAGFYRRILGVAADFKLASPALGRHQIGQ